jgi:hypothetical protein
LGNVGGPSVERTIMKPNVRLLLDRKGILDAMARIIPGVGFLRVRCYTELNYGPGLKGIDLDPEGFG